MVGASYGNDNWRPSSWQPIVFNMSSVSGCSKIIHQPARCVFWQYVIFKISVVFFTQTWPTWLGCFFYGKTPCPLRSFVYFMHFHWNVPNMTQALVWKWASKLKLKFVSTSASVHCRWLVGKWIAGNSLEEDCKLEVTGRIVDRRQLVWSWIWGNWWEQKFLVVCEKKESGSYVKR